MTTPPKTPNDRPLATWWKDFSSDTSWLGHRLNELRTAPDRGWHATEPWIKTTAAIGAILTGLLALRLITALATSTIQALPWPLPTDPTGLIATINEPVHTYITTHTATLPATATTIYSLWQVTGASAFALSLLRSSGARLTWLLWGTATTAMVWAGTPTDDRAIAAGIAATAWAALSVLALRGISLTPTVHIHAPAPHHPLSCQTPTPQPAPTYREFHPGTFPN